ncbi:MAG: hypothetical protein ACI4O7_14765 [Aristaeellaceae bacterium]
MSAIRRLIGRLLRRRRRDPAPDHYDRHWGEWWIFLEEFRAGTRDDGEE